MEGADFAARESMRGKLILSNLTWLLCAAACLATPSAQSSESLLERGIKLLSQGQYPAAISHFQQYKQTNPQDARPYFYAGLALTEAGHLSAAALEVDEAVRLDPQRLEALILQAHLFARLKQKAAAEEALARLPKQGIERLEASWLWMLSDVYYRLERFPDVLGWLDLLEQRNPDDPRLDLNRGQIHALQSQFEQAQTALQKSIAKYPANALAHFELGKLLHLRNDLPGAKTALQAAVRRDEKNPQYLQKLGAVCLALREFDDALTYLERAAALDANSSQAFYSLSQAYQRKGNREKAAALMKQFQALKQREEAREEAERILARGERMLDEGKEAEAQAAFEQVVQADSQNWTAHGYLAEMWLAVGNSEKAWPHLAKMEELEAESVVGNYLLARYWVGRKEFQRARGYAEKVKLARPAHAALRSLLGQIYLGLEQREQALAEFEEAVRLAPERADFRAQLQQLKKQ
jgi:tetratricopeptide (TPR) repeat protein